VLEAAVQCVEVRLGCCDIREVRLLCITKTAVWQIPNHGAEGTPAEAKERRRYHLIDTFFRSASDA